MIATRYNLMQLFPDQPQIVGVEVGTDQGVLASDWLRNEPRLYLHTVDNWLPFAENTSDRLYAIVQYGLNMRPFAGRYEHHMQTSLEAALSAAKMGNTFDLVYIDAAHDQFNVWQDLQAWWPLVKLGGYLAGHDFELHGHGCNVTHPVVDFVKRHRLNLQLINEHGGPDQAKDDGVLRPGSGQDKYGGWAHLSWYFKKEQ